MKIKHILVVFAAVLVGFALPSTSQAYTFTRDLTIGSQGADVVQLQTFLEARGALVMPVGVSKGYFGPITQGSLGRYQASVGIVPPAGYFGPITRAFIHALPSTPVIDNNNGGNDNDDDDNDVVLRGGDGDFRGFDVLGSPSNEDIEEGETAEVLGFEFEADDSDLLVERLDAVFTAGGTRPWRVFEEISIYVEDDEVVTMSADDEDNWSEEDDDEYRIRFDDIDEIVREGDEVRMYIVVTVQDNVDDDEYEDWTVFIQDDGVRARNAEDIYVYEGNDNDTKTFSIEEATGGDVDISVDTDDNDDMVVEVSEDDETDEVLLYTAQIESDEGDNLIEEVTINIATTSGTASNLSDMIRTLYLFIDGEEVGSESVDSAGTDSVTFDDIDFELDEGDEVDLEVYADINEQEDNYDNTDGVQVTGISIDYIDERDDDITVTSDVDGGEISFNVDAIMVDFVSETSVAPVAADESKGRFTVTFKVTAPDEENIFIPKGATTSTEVDSGQGAEFVVINGSGTTVSASTSLSTSILAKVSGGSETGGYYRISKGNTAQFRLDVIVDNMDAESARILGIQLTGINYKAGSTGTADTQYTAGLDEEFRSSTEYLLTENVSN